MRLLDESVRGEVSEWRVGGAKAGLTSSGSGVAREGRRD